MGEMEDGGAVGVRVMGGWRECVKCVLSWYRLKHLCIKEGEKEGRRDERIKGDREGERKQSQG